MTDEEIAIKLTKHQEEISSLKHRVDDVEELVHAVNELAVSVGKLAENVSSANNRMDRYEDSLRTQGERIGEIEKRPSKRWDTLTTVIITAIASGLITYIFTEEEAQKCVSFSFAKIFYKQGGNLLYEYYKLMISTRRSVIWQRILYGRHSLDKLHSCKGRSMRFCMVALLVVANQKH